MADGYFNKFPIITYRNTAIRDISRRIVLPESLRRETTAFYPYEIDHGTRSNVLSDQYYDDPEREWLVYLTNQIVDPYYGWYLNDFEMSDHIIDKYGSLTDPQQRISHWANNWANDDISITPGYYNTGLPEQLKKYYIPNYGNGTAILSYSRRQEDWVVNTNRIVVVTYGDEHGLAIGDIVRFTVSQAFVGDAEVVAVDGLSVTVKNVVGTLDDTCDGIESTEIIVQNLTDDEQVMWTPVYYFDKELDDNEKNKIVLLLDRGYADAASEALRQRLAE